MKITQITVRAAMTLPTVSFGNIKPEVELTATLDSGEDEQNATAILQAVANNRLIEHVRSLKAVQEGLKDG